MENTKYGKHIVTALKVPGFVSERAESYARWANRILWMDQNVVDGAFQMNCSWYLRKPGSGDSGEVFARTHDSSISACSPAVIMILLKAIQLKRCDSLIQGGYLWLFRIK